MWTNWPDRWVRNWQLSAGVLTVAGREPEHLACFGRLRGNLDWEGRYLCSAEPELHFYFGFQYECFCLALLPRALLTAVLSERSVFLLSEVNYSPVAVIPTLCLIYFSTLYSLSSFPLISAHSCSAAFSKSLFPSLPSSPTSPSLFSLDFP